MNYDALNNDPELQDNSNFDASYNEEYDFLSDYEDIMNDMNNDENLDQVKKFAEDTNDFDFYQIADDWAENEYEDDVTGDIARQGKRSYTKLKDGDNVLKKEFAEELTMLNDLLDEVNKFGKKLDKKYESMSGSKIKGVSKYTNDLIQSILTTKSTKLQIVKELTSLKKNILELQLKEGKRFAGEGEGDGAEYSANSYFKEIMRVGRNNFMDALNDNSPSIQTNNDTPEEIEYANKLSERNEMLDDHIAKRLEQETDRSDEANKYILYENLNVELKIKYNAVNDDWRIIAVGDNGNEVLDYPIPDKKDLGKVKFSADHKYATDKFGRSYKVIEIYE